MEDLLKRIVNSQKWRSNSEKAEEVTNDLVHYCYVQGGDNTVMVIEHYGVSIGDLMLPVQLEWISRHSFTDLINLTNGEIDKNGTSVIFDQPVDPRETINFCASLRANNTPLGLERSITIN